MLLPFRQYDQGNHFPQNITKACNTNKVDNSNSMWTEKNLIQGPSFCRLKNFDWKQRKTFPVDCFLSKQPQSSFQFSSQSKARRETRRHVWVLFRRFTKVYLIFISDTSQSQIWKRMKKVFFSFMQLFSCIRIYKYTKTLNKTQKPR